MLNTTHARCGTTFPLTRHRTRSQRYCVAASPPTTQNDPISGPTRHVVLHWMPCLQEKPGRVCVDVLHKYPLVRTTTMRSQHSASRNDPRAAKHDRIPPQVCRCSTPNPHVPTSRKSSPFLAPSLYTHIPTQRGEIVVDPQGTFSLSCSYTGAQRISRKHTCPICSLGAWSSVPFIGGCMISVAQTRCHTGAMKRLTRDAV